MKPVRLLLFFALLCITSSATAQNDSCRLRISLLTCSPGAELYSTFGHTAIRVTDSIRAIDIVFNYGTFDDSDPDFYVKFTKGIMRYALSAYSYQDFLQEYRGEHRGVIEQELQLSYSQKQQLYQALQVNAQEQNRFYNYYFHTDNCTTRARDMIVQKTGIQVLFGNILPPKHPTYRQLIHSYLNNGGEHWSKLGIDMVLGSNLDKQVTNEQAMFLPDYLMKGIDSATIGGHAITTLKQTVLPVTGSEEDALWLTPGLLFTLVLLVVTALSFYKKRWSQALLTVFDCTFFLLIGLMGLLMVTLWAIRIDTVCRNNFNVWWALPTHLPMAFVLYLKRAWVRQYFRITMVLTILFALCWWMLPQQFNVAFIPLIGIILVRSYFRAR